MRFSLLTLVLLFAVSVPLNGQVLHSAPATAGVSVPDTTLAAQLQALARASERFARGLDSLRSGRFPVHVVTADEYFRYSGERVRQPATTRLHYQAADSRLVAAAFVVVDLEYLREAYAALGRSSAFHRDLQIMLAHELYGHLVPAAASGERRDVCFDPGRVLRRISPTAKGCPTERENLVRKELGLPERSAYRSLALEGEEVWEVIAGAYAPPSPRVVSSVGTYAPVVRRAGRT